MKLGKRISTTFLRWVATFSAALATAGLAFASPVSLEGATFGYVRTVPLESRIGPTARPTLAIIRGVGGVAFVREATGRDGWAVQSIRYQPANADGRRFSITLEQLPQHARVEVQPQLWDWEVVPLARFVSSNHDSAFTYFGELPKGTEPTIGGADVVSYHPDLVNTLLGLRLMQLDLMLFKPAFTGYFTDSKGEVVLGGGERQAFGADKNPRDKATVSSMRKLNTERANSAMDFLQQDCTSHPSRVCKEAGQPFSSYIVGDLLSPTEFVVKDGGLMYSSRGLCWQFSREAEPGEAGEVTVLDRLSESFCSKVQTEFQGINPIVYRSAARAMRHAALMRHYKSRDPAGFAEFVRSLALVKPEPAVSTPTEIGTGQALTKEELDRLLKALGRSPPR